MNEDKKIAIKIDLSVYDRVAALKTCYLFQDKCHTNLDQETDSVLIATLIPKNEPLDLNQIERQFHDELIDQQIRLENDKLFSEIRKLIVEQAFKPISYKDLKAKIRK